jgi:hypothetical protein
LTCSIHCLISRQTTLLRLFECTPHCGQKLIVYFSATHTFDSDDDDDSVPEIDAEASYRRSAELLFSSDLDDERSMAAMRGALAAGKRVPSKEALASLEIVKVEDLEENGRSMFSIVGVTAILF